MVLQYYIIESATGKHINIEVDAASKDDLEITRSGWQTVWDTDFILDPQKEKYVAKTEEGEIVALGAYRVREGSVAVYIAYIEQPHSDKAKEVSGHWESDDRIWHPTFNRCKL